MPRKAITASCINIRTGYGQIVRKSISQVQIFTQYSASYGKIFSPGGMAEWFKATDLKSVVAARPPGVRIPLPPLGWYVYMLTG